MVLLGGPACSVATALLALLGDAFAAVDLLAVFLSRAVAAVWRVAAATAGLKPGKSKIAKRKSKKLLLSVFPQITVASLWKLSELF